MATEAPIGDSPVPGQSFTQNAPPAPPTPPQPPAAPGGESDDETLGDTGKKALERERKARRDAETKLKELEPLAQRAREAEEANKSEVTKANETLAAERDARQKAEAQLLRFEVATDKGVPSNLVKFLTGSNKEELEEAADELLAAVGNHPSNGNGAPAKKGAKPTPALTQSAASPATSDLDPFALLKQARGET